MASRNLEPSLPSYSEYGVQPTISRKVHFNDKQGGNFMHFEFFPESNLKDTDYTKDDGLVFTNDRIKSNDPYFGDNDIKDAVERERDRFISPQNESKNLDIQAITSKLKQSYESIDRGQDVLKKVSNELYLSKNKLMCHQCAVYNKDTARDVDRLLNEVESLQNHLQNVAKRKKKYIEELSLLQVALHKDRAQMEAWFQQSTDSKRVLKTRLDESSKVTRDQRKMIHKLKSDNIALWKLLQEVQEHLRNEHQKGNEVINNFQSSSTTKQLSDIPIRREMDIYQGLFTDGVASSTSSSSLEVSQDGRVSGSSNTSNENYLSEKLRHLIAQTEHIKQAIPNIDNHQHELMDKNKLWGSGLSLRDCRIPSENEQGMRSDMNDIMSRCEDLEKKVDQCSTKDIREILMHQLHEIDQESSSTSTSSKESHWKRLTELPCIWNPEQHQRAREDILQCLDKIALLERNFNGTQEEVRRLRTYIKETAEEKEFCEKTYKREAMDLRKVLENKSEEIEKLKAELDFSQKYVEENKTLKAKIEKLEKKIRQKNEENAKLLHKENETRFLKTLVEEKNVELEKLKLEMQTALDKMERLRLQGEINEGSNNALKSDMKILQERNDELRASIEENIQEELALLQSAILEAERRMDRMKEENNFLKEKSIAAEAFSRGERPQYEIDNIFLVNRIKSYEEELQKVNKEMHTRLLAENENEILLKKKDSLIKVLNENLNALKEEISRGLNINVEANSNKDIEFLIGQLMAENKRLVEDVDSKGNMIEEFRHAFKNVAAEWDHRISFETDDSLKETTSKKLNFDAVLSGIKKSLKTSHFDLADKVAALHKELKEMKEENRALKKKPDSSTRDSRLKIRFEKLNEENERLRELISSTNIDEVKSVLSRENDRLSNENILLRTALNEDRKELVDSNLRKRDKIKLLEQELKEVKKRLRSNLKHRTSNEDLTFSRDNLLNNSKERILNQSKEKNEHNFALGEPSGLPPKSKRKGMKNRSLEASSNEKAAFAEMIQQNEIIRKLQEENERLRMNTTTNKEDKKEIEVLKSEREKMKLIIRSNETIEDEVNELKNELKEKSKELAKSKEKIADFEEEVRFLKTNNEGLTPAGSPNAKRFAFNKAECEALMIENSALKSDLDKALKDIEKLIEIVDRRKSNLEHPLNAKKSVSCNDITILDQEKKKGKKSYRNSQQSLDDSMTEIVNLQRELNASEISRNEAYDEIAKLKAILQNLRHEKDRGENAEARVLELKKIIEDLNNTLEEAMREKRKMASQSLQDKINFEEKIDSMIRKMDSMIEDINKLKDEKSALEEDYANVIKKLENVKQNEDGDWFQSDLNKRFSLLSPDEFRGSISDRKHVRDHGRLIRKLQVENQTLRAKMLNLEEEGVETVKIIADMERGHGHLTGTLRTHLVLQKASTAKLLDGSIEQYASDFENFKRKFKALETKYDRDKKSSRRRDHAWDLFTNASASITNIHNILNEGFFKFEEDLEKDLDEEFVNKDYKSRLWIMRRQLSDVEKRHRELQLRAEELNLRLHAKTAEYEVTQEELEDTTRDLESRETLMQKLKKDSIRLSKENQSLSKIIKLLQENEEKTIKEVIMHNTVLQSEINELSESHDNRLRDVHANILELSESLEDKQKTLSEATRSRDLAKKETEECKRRIQYLERKLHEMTEQRDKLKKESENRIGYMAKANEDRGTIHLLRDDLKKIAKENGDLKQELAIKQRLMYDMSKDLHSLRMKEDGKLTERKVFRKEEEYARMLHEISELKTEKFILETKVKDLERKRDKPVSKDDKFLEKTYRDKLVAKEAEIQEIRGELTFIKNQEKKQNTSTNNISDQNDDISELLISNKKLQQNLKDTEESRDVEIKALTKDIHQKRRRISELLRTIDELKEAKWPKISEIEKLVESVEVEEQQSLMLEIDAKERDIQEWKKKAQDFERELQQARIIQSASSHDDDKFKKVYLNKMIPYSGSALSGGYLDRKTPGQDSLSLISKTPEEEYSYQKPEIQEAIDKEVSIYEPTATHKEVSTRSKSNDVLKKLSKIPQRRPPVPKVSKSKLRHESPNATAKSENCEEDIGNEDDPDTSYDKVIKLLYGELDVYRNTLGITENKNLSTLGQDRLIDVIENHVYDKYGFLQMQQDIDELIKQNEILKSSQIELWGSSKESIYYMPKVLAEKNSLLVEENKSLRELLETQTQNVSSQERVIKALKDDMEKCKEKYIEHCDRISEELKEKKKEVRRLKKHVKELNIAKSKEDINVSNSRNESRIQDQSNTSLSVNASPLIGQNLRVEELEKKLKETEHSYEDVLKEAEKALEVAKHKLTIQHQHNKELTKKVTEIHEDNRLKDKYFEEIKKELTEALVEKNNSLSTLHKDFQEYKRKREEEYDKITKQLREAERQCQDYKILLENSESTTSEFVCHSKNEAIHLKTELNETKSTIEGLKLKNQKLKEKNESLANTLDMISDDRSMKTDADDKNDEDRNVDYEIEYEILKGCNEELEEQILNLENNLRENEKFIQQAENAINEAKVDAEIASTKLQHATNKFEIAEEEKQKLQQKVKELEQQIYELETRGRHHQDNKALQKQSVKDSEEIEQLRRIVDEYESQMQKSNTILKKDQLIQRKSSIECKKEDTREKLLEEQLNNQSEVIENLKNQNENQQQKLSTLKTRLIEKQDQLQQKDKEISNLELQLQKWILKSTHESDQPNESKLCQTKTLLEQSKKILDTSKELEELTRLNNTESFEVNIAKEFLVSELRKKNSALQEELDSKCIQIEKHMASLNKTREELKGFVRMQDKLQNEINRKEKVIQKLKHLLKPDESCEESIDASLDVSAAFGESYEESKDSAQTYEKEGNSNVAFTQLSIVRSRNKSLLRDLHKAEQENLTYKAVNKQFKEQETELKNELQLAREKINRLRSLIYENSTNESNFNVKAKILTAYEELREKSIEIAKLNLKIEIQSCELDNLKTGLFPRSHEADVINKKEPHQATESDDQELIIDDHELIDQNAQLRNQLISKSQHCDFLQEQIFKLVEKVRDIEKSLMHENEYLIDKYIFEKDAAEQTDVTEVTPLGNTITLMSKKVKDDANETILLDGFEEYKTDPTDLKKISELEQLTTQKEDKISFLKEEIKKLKLQNNNHINEIENLIKELEEQQRNLCKANANLQEKEETIKCLQTQLISTNNKALKSEQETRKLKQEMQSLFDQLNAQKRCYDDDIINTKSTYLQVKEEHINSLKEELASTTEEKLKLQVLLKELQLIVNQKEELAKRYLKEKQKCDFNLKMKEEEMDELVNALSLLEAENIRLVDCLNMRVL